MDFHFPMHYVHGWLTHYFGTHYLLPIEVRGPKMTNFSGEGGSIYFGEYEARELIHNGARIQRHANQRTQSFFYYNYSLATFTFILQFFLHMR